MGKGVVVTGHSSVVSRHLSVVSGRSWNGTRVKCEGTTLRRTSHLSEHSKLNTERLRQVEKQKRLDRFGGEAWERRQLRAADARA